MKYGIFLAVVVELDLVGELIAQIGANGRAEVLGVLVDADADQLADFAFHRKIGFLFDAQRGELGAAAKRGLHLAVGPLALARNDNGARAIEREAGAFVADKASQGLGRGKGHSPLKAVALAPALLGGGAAKVAADLLVPKLPVLGLVFQAEIVVYIHGDRWSLGKPADAAAVVGHSHGVHRGLVRDRRAAEGGQERSASPKGVLARGRKALGKRAVQGLKV